MKECITTKRMKAFCISAIVLLALAIASGWVYHFIYDSKNSSISKDEFVGLQMSFMKQYGIQSNIIQVIVPKIYEVAWSDPSGGKNVSMNVGSVWVLIANQPSSPPVNTSNSTGGR